jgi:hypothetical protein
MNQDLTWIDPTWMAKNGGFAKDMTMRDHYAGLAMQAIRISKPNTAYIDISNAAYVMADEMLKAREAK